MANTDWESVRSRLEESDVAKMPRTPSVRLLGAFGNLAPVARYVGTAVLVEHCAKGGQAAGCFSDQRPQIATRLLKPADLDMMRPSLSRAMRRMMRLASITVVESSTKQSSADFPEREHIMYITTTRFSRTPTAGRVCA